MIRSIKALFQKSPAFFWFSVACLVSTIGCGLTQVAIYGELARLHAESASFAAAFALSVLPGVISGQIGGRIAYRFRWTTIFTWTELLGALALAIPAAAITRHQIPLLLASQFSSSFLAGIALPAMMLFQAQELSEKELPAAAVVGNMIFAGQALLGIGIGTLLFPYIRPLLYLLIDFGTYLAAASGFYLLSRGDSEWSRTTDQPTPVVKVAWTRSKRRAFWLLPLLSMIGAPAIALLPTLGMKAQSVTSVGWILIDPVLVLIFAKTLGQLMGPFLLKADRFEQRLHDSRFLAALGAGFIGCYFIAFSGIPFVLSCALVFVAHLLSNVIFVIGQFALPRYFSSEEVAMIAGRQYQLQVLVIALWSLTAGALAMWIGARATLALSVVPLLMTASLMGGQS